MNRILFLLAAVLLWSAAMFGAGWVWRGDRAQGATATRDADDAKAEAAAQADARQVEHTQGQAMADIGAKHEEDRAAAEAVPAAVVADLRTGNLQLRDDLATCQTQRLSDAAAGAAQRDAPAQLREEVAGDLVRLARDADDQVRAAQAVIQADRAGSASSGTVDR
ncbi:MAG: lysis system i-spanin subunit Rz [Xanthomonas sp.]